LSNLLNDRDLHLRRQVARSIAEIKRTCARKVAQSMAQGATLDDQVQRAQDVDVVLEALIHSLNDPDPATCIYATRALGLFGDHRAVEGLIQALQTGNASLRAAAAWAVGKIGDLRVIGSLIEALQTDEDAAVRFWAAWALGTLGDKRALTALEYTAKHDAGRLHSDRSIREAAIEAMERIKRQGSR